MSMDTHRRINMAIASSERNQEAMELIRNWCRHIIHREQAETRCRHHTYQESPRADSSGIFVAPVHSPSA
jgi:hypothetical protein